jgi:hypothetical protein
MSGVKRLAVADVQKEGGDMATLDTEIKAYAEGKKEDVSKKE